MDSVFLWARRRGDHCIVYLRNRVGEKSMERLLIVGDDLTTVSFTCETVGGKKSMERLLIVGDDLTTVSFTCETVWGKKKYGAAID
jgi:hypothetical protein